MLINMIRQSMGRITIIILLAEVFFLLWVAVYKNLVSTWMRRFLLCSYLLVLCYFTLCRQVLYNRQIELNIFWSYRFFSQADIRWQIYLNILLFVPLGFLLPFVLNRKGWQTILTGLLLSLFVEGMQYFFRLGFCEFDDVFHNTLGIALGYGYWALLEHIELQHGDQIRGGIRKLLGKAHKLLKKIGIHHDTK